MQVKVLYFAVFRERIAAPQQIVELMAAATVNDLLAVLGQQHPVIESMRGYFRVAVNEQFAALEQLLHDNDIIALIPPVSGG